ncbi:WXG100 family type VII secretion target [Streptomyces chartreusis]|uniref:WXG100 family type VII secretion target n=1 Tax=Streptomyces chartreusis TaxID=1969 RepID=A0A7I0Y8X9_STRCX|nr:WXG100 family type VII secretion target [Streptomyces chartreusis]QKZ15960.1 WXG100 family type VII secretion target [Streptomyces chartreusis]
MSSNYFAVDPDSLAKNAPNVRAYSDQMRQVVTRLETRLRELGDCWGDDPMGKTFAEQYVSPRDQMIEGLKGIVDVLDSTADGLQTMAKGFHATEDQNTKIARDFERGTTDAPTHPGSVPETGASGGSRGHGAKRV